MFKAYMLAPVSPEKHRACQDYVLLDPSQTVRADPDPASRFSRYAHHSPLTADQAAPRHHLYRRRPEFALISEHGDIGGGRDRGKAPVPAEFLDGTPLCFGMDESEIFAGPGGGLYHVFDFLKRRADVSEGSFFAELAGEADLLSRDADFRRAALRCCHNRIDRGGSAHASDGESGEAADRDYDAIVDIWTDSLDALARFHPDMRTRQSFYVDQRASFSIIATEHVVIERPLAAV